MVKMSTKMFFELYKALQGDYEKSPHIHPAVYVVDGGEEMLSRYAVAWCRDRRGVVRELIPMIYSYDT